MSDKGRSTAIVTQSMAFKIFIWKNITTLNALQSLPICFSKTRAYIRMRQASLLFKCHPQHSGRKAHDADSCRLPKSSFKQIQLLPNRIRYRRDFTDKSDGLFVAGQFSVALCPLISMKQSCVFPIRVDLFITQFDENPCRNMWARPSDTLTFAHLFQETV